jgi:uncharacterized protein
MNATESIDEYLNQILAALNIESVEKVILFGSAASGQMGPDSDLDLLIVMDTDYLPRTYQERMEYRLQIQRKVRDIRKKVALDLLIYTRPEYKLVTQDMSSFMKDVHDLGKVIYEKAG